VPSENVELGYYTCPDSGPNRGVVMIHDVWGLSDHARDMARRLARDGFAVLAVDLYRREAKVKIEDPGAWMRGLSDVQVLEDVQAAVDFLAKHRDTADSDVGVIGFCMGGTYALLAACGCRDVRASVSFYGLLSHEHGLLYDPKGHDPALKPRQPLDAVSDLACPFLGLFGAEDEFIPLKDVERLRVKLDETGQPHGVFVYPDAGHAFMNDTRPQAFRPEIAEEASARAVRFLQDHLR